MSSIFSVNQLGMGLTMPIKMRRLIERPASGKTQAFNKLAQILCEKMYIPPKDKQVKKNDRKSLENSNSNLKNRRALSQKSSNQKKGMNHSSTNDRYFSDFFEQIQTKPKNAGQQFKPYHHQSKAISRTQMLTPTNSRKKALTIIKKQHQLFKQIDTNEPSVEIGKWEIKQDMQNFSLLYAKSLKRE